jgi:competence protein ComEA
VPTCYTRARSLARVFEDVDKGRLVAYAAVALLVIAVALRMHSHGSGGASVSLEEPARAATGPASATEPAGATGPASAAGAELYIDVAGAVRRPGLYRLPAGSRVAAAVEQAGGLSRRAERTGVNLAAPLADGQQVIVPARGSAGAPAGEASGTSGPAGAAGPISLSTASEAQLETIDGIGPALAGRIIEYRDAHGGFRSIDELKQVSGIGDKRFETLRKALSP